MTDHQPTHQTRKPAIAVTGLRWFAEHQPFTLLPETLRGLLLGTAIGSSAVQAVGWCIALTVVGYLWSKYQFRRAASR
ncbi:ABC transporter permease [Actinomadura logoneensis]|uniref:ABC transporter permease n=1 Tax=Actinomadura logoneensis TaxID=2293572 RepID=UPI0018F18A65|nr:ABC transporter permease [Actinomadura logoneensis]